MTHRKWKPKWSLLLIRDADHRVKQFRVSSRTVVFLPIAAAITVAGSFATLELQAYTQIKELESRLANRTTEHTRVISSKNGEISSLQQELSRLNGQSEELRSRMNGLNELEQKLRQFIGNYGEGLSDPLTAKSLPGSEVAASAFQSMEKTITDFTELSLMLDEMAVNMESSLRKAELKRSEMNAMPSEWPTVSRKLTSGFGYRRDPLTGTSAFHAGVDISGDIGDPIYAAGEGKIREAAFDRTRGHYIIITHRNGLESWYMHMSAIDVENGQLVERGQLIGKLGNSGRSTGPHLHFQVVISEEPVNPLRYLQLVKED